MADGARIESNSSIMLGLSRDFMVRWRQMSRNFAAFVRVTTMNSVIVKVLLVSGDLIDRASRDFCKSNAEVPSNDSLETIDGFLSQIDADNPSEFGRRFP